MAVKRITEAEMDQKGVIAAPDILNGTPAQNKAIFDRMVRQLVAPAVNACADAVENIEQAQNDWSEHEQIRVETEQERQSKEQIRVDAETERVEAEAERANAEAQRVSAETERAAKETARIGAEQIRVEAEARRDAAEQERKNSTSGIVAQATEQAVIAQNSAAAAGASETNAARSASEAAESAGVAQREAGLADASANRANGFADEAKGARDSAQVYANSAAGSADAAQRYMEKAGEYQNGVNASAAQAEEHARSAAKSEADAETAAVNAENAAEAAAQGAVAAVDAKMSNYVYEAQAAKQAAEKARDEAQSIAGGDFVTHPELEEALENAGGAKVFVATFTDNGNDTFICDRTIAQITEAANTEGMVVAGNIPEYGVVLSFSGIRTGTEGEYDSAFFFGAYTYEGNTNFVKMEVEQHLNRFGKLVESSFVIYEAPVPLPTVDDDGKFLRIVNGAPAWATVQNAEEVSF